MLLIGKGYTLVLTKILRKDTIQSQSIWCTHAHLHEHLFTFDSLNDKSSKFLRLFYPKNSQLIGDILANGGLKGKARIILDLADQNLKIIRFVLVHASYVYACIIKGG